MMSDLKDRLLEEKLIVILRGLAEEKLIATVDILKNMGMHFFELAIDNESELSMEKSLRNIEGLRKHYGDSIHIGAGTVINKLQVKRDCRDRRRVHYFSEFKRGGSACY